MRDQTTANVKREAWHEVKQDLKNIHSDLQEALELITKTEHIGEGVSAETLENAATALRPTTEKETTELFQKFDQNLKERMEAEERIKRASWVK